MVAPNVITGLTTENRSRLLRSCTDRTEALTRPGPINRGLTRDALVQLYSSLHLDPPQHFLHYSSPSAAFDRFVEWEQFLGAIPASPCLWRFQLPLFDPLGFWRQLGDRKSICIDLAVDRWSNQSRCWAYGRPLEVEGDCLSPEAHAEVWNITRSNLNLDWPDLVVSSLESKFPLAVARLAGLVLDTFDSNDALDYVLLGPFEWLVREVAAVEFCHAELGARINRPLYEAISSLLNHGSLIFTFNTFCLVCDAPTEISPMVVRYRDGTKETPGESSAVTISSRTVDAVRNLFVLGE